MRRAFPGRISNTSPTSGCAAAAPRLPRLLPRRLALTAIVCDPVRIACRKRVEIDCEAPDAEYLLVDWLNAVIYEMATRHMLFGRFEVEIHEHRLHGRAYGEAIDVQRHEPAVEIKGATYTALEVRHDEHGVWHAQCVPTCEFMGAAQGPTRHFHGPGAHAWISAS